MLKNYAEVIDRLFDENRPKEAEKYMLSELENAVSEKCHEDELFLLNELIGYYRQTSEDEQCRKIIEQSLSLIDNGNASDSVEYSTTRLNCANAYRAMGEYEKSKILYSLVEQDYNTRISSGKLDQNDMRVAGLYNNMSLLFQESMDYENAEKFELMSLDIAKVNNAGFEIAVTYANLANTYLLAKRYEDSIKNANVAIGLFEDRGLRDPHYCAALSALGNCYFELRKVAEANLIITKAMEIVESTFGRNKQYDRLQESLDLCKKYAKENNLCLDINGMSLCRMYYEDYGKEMIHNKFSKFESRIAVGLVGEGSDCYGFDDELSRDHDFGPDFCMWLSDEVFDEIGEALQDEYNKLPKSYLGVERTITALGNGRRGVLKISDFYSKLLGIEVTGVNDTDVTIDFASIPEYALAVCTNGAVFRDDEGTFTNIRNRLKQGYPANVRLLKIAEDVANFSQTGQYNYERMMKRGDEVTASLMLADFVKVSMKLFHHIMNVYAPHDKWLVKSTKSLPNGNEIAGILHDILKLNLSKINILADFFAQMLYANGDISDMDNYIGHHVPEIMFKSTIVMLDKKTLVNKIARLEFEAFDKVDNEGGRASCQNDWPTFSVMRKSQYLTWNMDMLVQYMYDFTREYESGHNLITEKYGRMMESTAPEKYEEIKDYFPPLSEEKKAVIEQIVGIQMRMVEEFAAEHPKVAGNARDLHTSDDAMFNTSYETYLRGEISTYSDKMLQLYGGFVVQCATTGQNIAQLTIENTAKLYGFKDLVAFENA